MTSIFMTGGTGLVGRWLIRTLKRNYPDVFITVLTRFPEQNRHLGVTLLEGDVQTFKFPDQHFDYIVHAAVDCTDRALEMCRINDATMLYTSSGAVYGMHDNPMPPIQESAPMTFDTDYATKKGMGEIACRQSGLKVKIARLFTFAGGGQPLDYHYAIGNFIRDGLNGGPIRLKDGKDVYRSYLHYSEMAWWLIQIMFHGENHPYNVGSEQIVNINDLAYDVAEAFRCRVDRYPAMTGNNRWYIPSTRWAQKDLRLHQELFYPDVLYRMITEVKAERELAEMKAKNE